MFVAIINKTEFIVTASQAENLVRTSYLESYTARSNGSQRQINIQEVSGNTLVIIEPACQSLVLDMLKAGCHN